jgi:hypothetical protein
VLVPASGNELEEMADEEPSQSAPLMQQSVPVRE